MKSIIKLTVITLSLTLFGAIVFAQTPDDDDQVSVFEVRLPVTVNKKKKKKELITNLSQSDFVVLEDGVPQEITYFTNDLTNPPVYVGVLMDTSPSTQGKLRFSKQAAKDFLYTVLERRKDMGAFMTFDHRIELHQDFTQQTDLLDRAVEQVEKVGSKTALYDAIWQFADQKLRTVPGRRVIVVITDGDDTFSKAELSDAIDIAQRTETTIFAISTKEGFLGSVPGVELGTIKDRGDKLLERLCEATGGRAFFTGDMLALEKSFTKISEELKGQYILTYRPANQTLDGKTRKIEVRFRDRNQQKKYVLRTKAEYRAVRDAIKQ